jgi:diguanylate cyclase (GGDEF)-like protein
MVLSDSVLCTGFGGFLAGAACVWLHGSRLRTELTRTRWAAEHDGLTSLPNRAGIRARYQTDRAAGRQNSLVLLDLNGFKQVNDTFGHHVGDRLLVEVAQRLAEACRPVGFPGRLGGDEFLILLPQPAPVKAAVLVQALLSRIAAPITLGRDIRSCATLTATASAGIATAAPESTWNTQLRQADIALYHAKDHPGGIVLFQEGMQHPPSAPGRRRPIFAAETG